MLPVLLAVFTGYRYCTSFHVLYRYEGSRGAPLVDRTIRDLASIPVTDMPYRNRLAGAHPGWLVLWCTMVPCWCSTLAWPHLQWFEFIFAEEEPRSDTKFYSGVRVLINLHSSSKFFVSDTRYKVTDRKSRESRIGQHFRRSNQRGSGFNIKPEWRNEIVASPLPLSLTSLWRPPNNLQQSSSMEAY